MESQLAAPISFLKDLKQIVPGGSNTKKESVMSFIKIPSNGKENRDNCPHVFCKGISVI